MDWIRQIPMGQYVDGKEGWVRRLDPRLKLAWSLMFLVTPVLAGPIWRIALVLFLLSLTIFSGLPLRIWRRPLLIIVALAIFVGIFSMLLPIGEPGAVLPLRSPNELSGVTVDSPRWNIFILGPFVVDRGSAILGVRTSTLTFTLIHSVNLMLITTTPEDLVWALSWLLAPFGLLGFPSDRLGFQLLLALRFVPLVQEELQNLLRSLSSRAVSLKSLGLKGAFLLVLAVIERLLANILLRAEQGADALIARGGKILEPSKFRLSPESPSFILNLLAGFAMPLILALRFQYGDL